jgi:hypothetical protein
MILHVVGLKFVPEMSEEEIVAHFETEVVLHERMPVLRQSIEMAAILVPFPVKIRVDSVEYMYAVSQYVAS